MSAATGKAAVDHGAVSDDQAAAVLAEYFTSPPAGPPARLYGGYSAANYRVTIRDGPTVLLKCCNDQPAHEAEQQASAVRYLREHGVATATPYPRRDELGGGDVSVALGPSRPSLVFEFLPGTNADAVCRVAADGASDQRSGGSGGGSGSGSGSDAPLRVLRSAGVALGKLHRVPLPPAGSIRHCMASRGACMVGVQRDAAAAMAASPHTRGHPFTAYHAASLPALERAIRAPGLPETVLHGDPFLDNMLADPATLEVTGLVDWEDVAVGPAVFDVAACAAGSCYGGDNALDEARLGALLEGYCSTRTLTGAEVALFSAFVRVALLCNAAWRFQNFHIAHREVAHARDSYKELHDRCVAVDTDPSPIADAARAAARGAG